MFLTKKDAVFTFHCIYQVKNHSDMKWNKNTLLLFLLVLLCEIGTSCTSHDDELLQSSGIGSFSTLGTVVNTARLTVHSDSYGPLLPMNTDIFIKNNANGKFPILG